MNSPKILVRFQVSLLALSLSACSTFFKAQNNIASRSAQSPEYNMQSFNQVHDYGENMIMLAFSGGGTRAAALSYGVMQELNETYYPSQTDEQRSVLQDVDMISAVSGGSFTAAYYGAYGDRLFKDYEQRFLRQSVESALISTMLSPTYWIRTLTSVFDRTELAIEYYDNTVFDRKTFADIPLDKRPLILLNATDLSLGQRFTFTQDTFNLICSDLSSFPLARAVTASSAVPIVFPSVVLKNYRAECSRKGLEPEGLSMPTDTKKQKSKDYIKMRTAYSDAKERSYLHLVDGGLSDNLGLRVVSDRIDVFGFRKQQTRPRNIKRLMIVLVNSNVEPKRNMDASPEIPDVSETLDAFTEALIQNRNSDTKSYFFDQDSPFKKHIKEQNPNVEVFLSEVSFTAIKSETQRQFLNTLPTSLELTNEQIDKVIAAGRDLLKSDASFQQFVESNRLANAQ